MLSTKFWKTFFEIVVLFAMVMGISSIVIFSIPFSLWNSFSPVRDRSDENVSCHYELSLLSQKGSKKP